MVTPASVKNGAPITEQGYVDITPMPWSSFASGVMTPGQVDEVPDLQWPGSIAVWHRMRTDSQMQALTNAYFLPMRRFTWSIRPNGAKDEHVEKIAGDFGLRVEGTDLNLGRRRGRFNHDDHLRHALLASVYGHMFCEQFGVIDDDLDWRLRKLAPRMPQSISQIRTARDGGLEGIVQHGTGGTPWNPDVIKVDRLVAYVWDREGSNWAGRSMYRACYKHWLRKDRLLRVDAMKNERYGLGIPTGRAPKGANANVIAEHGRLAQSIKADPDGGVGLANGADISIEGIRGALPDTLASIRYDDEAMARSFLAMFIQLGQTETGSRALGSEFINFFHLAVQAMAGWYQRITNEHVIEDIMDWNWGVDANAPLLVYAEAEAEEPIGAADLVQLIENNVLVVDDELRSWARGRWNLPAPTQAPGSGVAATRERIRGVHARTQTYDRPGQVGHRPRNDVEVAAAFDPEALQAAWEDAAASLVDEWATIQQDQIDALVDGITAAVDAANPTALAGLAAPVLGADVIGDHMMAAAETAVTGARAEAAAQGVQIELFNMAEIEPLVRARAGGVAVLMSRSLAETAARQALIRYGADVLDGTIVAAGVRTHLEELSDTYLVDQLGGALTQAQNMGRAAVMGQRPAKIYASELLDANTCGPCQSKDGHKYDTIDDAHKDYPTGGYSECQGGPRCRGTLVAVYDEATPTA